VTDQGIDRTSQFEVPDDMAVLYLGLLLRGPNWTPEETPEVMALQERHLAYIGAMAAEGKLLLAGPFLDGGHLRGVFVFRTGSLQEAQALAAADPSVQAGRLALDIHPWMVPADSLP
jgi:uncharacterized protein YciI